MTDFLAASRRAAFTDGAARALEMVRLNGEAKTRVDQSEGRFREIAAGLYTGGGLDYPGVFHAMVNYFNIHTADGVRDLHRRIQEANLGANAVSEREAVLRERRAFAAGADFSVWCHDRRAWINGKGEAEGRYPLPVRRRPLRVKLSDGTTWAWEDRKWKAVLYLQGDSGSHWFHSTPFGAAHTADDLRLLARCLDGEMEDAPEDEET